MLWNRTTAQFAVASVVKNSLWLGHLQQAERPLAQKSKFETILPHF